MLPAITITGYIFAALLGGVVIVEYIFSWPGVGAAALGASVYLDVNFLRAPLHPCNSANNCRLEFRRRCTLLVEQQFVA